VDADRDVARGQEQRPEVLAPVVGLWVPEILTR
jgi:hypothetical protein